MLLNSDIIEDITIPAHVLVDSLEIIKKCGEQKSTDDVIGKLKLENSVLKNHLLSNGLALPSESEV